MRIGATCLLLWLKLQVQKCHFDLLLPQLSLATGQIC
jgi:hypothetical protein